MTTPKRNLLQRLESRVRHELGLPLRWTTQPLLDHDLVLCEGTLRPDADYDDAWLYACMQHATVVFDVGANVGQSALMALLCPNVKHVTLVEANREALSVAAQNLIRNGLSARARFVCAFASDTSADVMDFWTVGTGAAGSMFQGHAVSATKKGSVHRVPTLMLDSMIESAPPDLVKIDVEGAESRVLAGATALARGQRTRFLVEMHSPPELPMERNASLILEWSASQGYACWYLSKHVRIDSPDPIKHRGRCHLLLQPSSWPYPAWLQDIDQSASLPGG